MSTPPAPTPAISRAAPANPPPTDPSWRQPPPPPPRAQKLGQAPDRHVWTRGPHLSVSDRLPPPHPVETRHLEADWEGGIWILRLNLERRRLRNFTANCGRSLPQQSQLGFQPRASWPGSGGISWRRRASPSTTASPSRDRIGLKVFLNASVSQGTFGEESSGD